MMQINLSNRTSVTETIKFAVEKCLEHRTDIGQDITVDEIKMLMYGMQATLLMLLIDTPKTKESINFVHWFQETCDEIEDETITKYNLREES
jgi:hypothetical protein